jgi:hypothetical protein
MLVTGYCTSPAAHRWTAITKSGSKEATKIGHSLRSWSAAVTALAAAPVAFVAIASPAVVAGHTFQDRQEC